MPIASHPLTACYTWPLLQGEMQLMHSPGGKIVCGVFYLITCQCNHDFQRRPGTHSRNIREQARGRGPRHAPCTVTSPRETRQAKASACEMTSARLASTGRAIVRCFTTCIDIKGGLRAAQGSRSFKAVLQRPELQSLGETHPAILLCGATTHRRKHSAARMLTASSSFPMQGQ